MEKFSFHANCVVSREPEDSYYLVGFADHDIPEYYLMLQRAFEYDDQDIELGMDTYHVEWCNQENSGYGGISRLTLHRHSVDIVFEPLVSAELDGLRQLAISFDLTEDQFHSLTQALQHIFENNACLEI